MNYSFELTNWINEHANMPWQFQKQNGILSYNQNDLVINNVT
jgi:hypothetical protein